MNNLWTLEYVGLKTQYTYNENTSVIAMHFVTYTWGTDESNQQSQVNFALVSEVRTVFPKAILVPSLTQTFQLILEIGILCTSRETSCQNSSDLALKFFQYDWDYVREE
jgi:hypothetical protein